VSTDVSAAEYLERLKVLRARCGLDNDVGTRTDSSLSDVALGASKPLASALHVLDGGVSVVSITAYTHYHSLHSEADITVSQLIT